ncbi:MAG TPA: nuclear transport factor 2 family protein [Dehalococcoidales bacterium]|nr:nuclear transport factor 2 family protein [Dehalococcoidales bacterium]
MDVKGLESRVKGLEEKVRILQDIEEINRLQRAYGFYLEHFMLDEIVDLFADRNDLMLNGAEGTKDDIRKFFKNLSDLSLNPEFLHQAMQLSGVVDVNPDGKTAEGRWYSLGSVALPSEKGVRPISLNGIYTVEYLKDNDKWKLKHLKFHPIILASPTEGWVKKDRLPPVTAGEPPRRGPSKPLDAEARYPSGYIVPFHFNHPVTGKKTSEAKHNAILTEKKEAAKQQKP